MKTATLLAFVCLSLLIILVAIANRAFGWALGREWVSPVLMLIGLTALLYLPFSRPRGCLPLRR